MVSVNFGIGKIRDIIAREVLDSRGNPTVEVEVHTDGGEVGVAIVPSGASTGTYEAVELRDGDKKRYNGFGVTKAVENVKVIKKKLIDLGMDVCEQRLIDSIMCDMDKSEKRNKGILGANAILGVSMACAKAGAMVTGLPLYRYLGNPASCVLPVPLMNILNGGKHADNNVDIQEFMIAPIGAPSFKEALRMGAEIYHHLKIILKDKAKREKRKLSTSVGDEGGFAPDLKSNEEALDVIIEAIKMAGYKAGKDVILALDCAANEMWNKWDGKQKKYCFFKSTKKDTTAEALIKLYDSWVRKYPLYSIEDPLHEEDWDNWSKMMCQLGKKIQIVGDDLYVTNPDRLERGIKLACSNSILIKLNQIGTVSETLDVIELAHRAGMTCVISHRSGETEDTIIADLAVAVNSGQIKTGAPCRTDRVAKYNRLLRIEEELGRVAEYAGDEVFSIFMNERRKK